MGKEIKRGIMGDKICGVDGVNAVRCEIDERDAIYVTGLDLGEGESFSDVYFVKNTTKTMESRLSDVIANIRMNSKVSGQDVRALSEIGIPVFDLMVSSLDVGLFVRNIVDYQLKTK